MRISPQLVATDLDGTIIRGDGTISARTVAAFARVEQAGRRFVLVTGRPPRVMANIAAAFGNRGVAICSNGALTYDMRTGLTTAGPLIAPAQLAAAARALRTAIPGIGIGVEYPDGWAADNVFHSISFDLNVEIPIPRPGDALLFARPAAKLLGRHMGYTPDELLVLAAPALDGLVAVTHSNGTGLIEAVATGVSKATAVAELAARHGIGRHAVVAFGDMPNDLPLLTWAGTSCAVANAHPDVLAAATYVIGSNDDDGVAAFLERLFPESEAAGLADGFQARPSLAGGRAALLRNEVLVFGVLTNPGSDERAGRQHGEPAIPGRIQARPGQLPGKAAALEPLIDLGVHQVDPRPVEDVPHETRQLAADADLEPGLGLVVRDDCWFLGVQRGWVHSRHFMTPRHPAGHRGGRSAGRLRPRFPPLCPDWSHRRPG